MQPASHSAGQADQDSSIAVLRIAMWSGPRNISSAMMRSWGSRPDTFVCDEPLYAHYLSRTDARRHPGHAATLASHETDWRKAVGSLLGPLPHGKAIFYQKHMAHHLLPEVETEWVATLRNGFLIRDPRYVLNSLERLLAEPTVADVGLPQQVRLYESLAASGQSPPIVDADDLLAAPERILRLLCDALGVGFLPQMLRWEPGPRETDGAWGPYWYGNLYASTGFERSSQAQTALPDRLQATYRECEPLYAWLYARRVC